MNDHLNVVAISRDNTNKKDDTHLSHTHSFLQGGYDKDDYVGQMIFGEPCGPKASCPDRVSKPSLLHDRRGCYCLLHSAAVDLI